MSADSSEVKTTFTGDAGPLLSAAGKAQGAVESFLATTGKAAAFVGQLNQVVELGVKGSKAYVAAQVAVTASATGVTGAIKAQTIAMLASPMAPVAAAALVLAGAFAYLNAKVEAQEAAYQDAAAAADAYRKAVAPVFDSIKDLSKETEDYTRRLKVATGALDSMEASHQKEKAALIESRDAKIDEANVAIQTAKANLEQAKSVKDNEVATRAATQALKGAREAKEELSTAFIVGKDALEKAQAAEVAKAKSDKAATDAEKARTKAERDRAESLRETEEATTKATEAERKREAEFDAMVDRQIALVKVQRDLDATIDTLDDTETDRLEKQKQGYLDEIALIEEKTGAHEEAAQRRAQVDAWAAKQTAEVERAETEKTRSLKQSATDQILSNLQTVGGAIEDQSRAGFVVSKGIALADIANSTAKGVMNAIATFTPIPVVGPALAAGAVATILAASAAQAGEVLKQQPEFHFGTSRVQAATARRVDEVSAVLRADEAVATPAAADRLGRDRIARANRGQDPYADMRGSGGGYQVLGHRVYGRFIRDDVRLPNPLRNAITGGRTIGLRDRG